MEQPGNAPSGRSQGEALARLWAAVIPANSFYREKFARAGCERAPVSLEAMVRDVPFTTKDELVADQARTPPYGTNLTFPLEAYTRCHQTSGTSGRPLRWLDTTESWTVMREDWRVVLESAGVRRGDRVLYAFSFGPFLGFWLAFEAGQDLGCLGFAGGGMTTAVRTRVLFENECSVLCCTPTYALHLAEGARKEGFNPEAGPVRRIVVAGEPGGSRMAFRQRLSEAWGGARVFDHHGMTEVGPVSYEDPERPGDLRILERSFLAEVIDPASGRAQEDGVEGELVLTTLRRLASPLIRYRTGDLVKRVCRGGSVVLEGGILGRVDDMVIVRGVNVYPHAVDEWIRAVAGPAEYRVTLGHSGAMQEMRIELEVEPGLARQVEQRLQSALALRIPVVGVPVGELPRFEHKARRWRRE